MDLGRESRARFRFFLLLSRVSFRGANKLLFSLSLFPY